MQIVAKVPRARARCNRTHQRANPISRRSIIGARGLKSAAIISRAWRAADSLAAGDLRLPAHLGALSSGAVSLPLAGQDLFQVSFRPAGGRMQGLALGQSLSTCHLVYLAQLRRPGARGAGPRLEKAFSLERFVGPDAGRARETVCIMPIISGARLPEVARSRRPAELDPFNHCDALVRCHVGSISGASAGARRALGAPD